ncbi:MAG: HEAT repeat domain-containing protein [Planctomyces sp.]|nr:HEAT repeat domain-containing protein [Planctomyces sp.]
MNRSATMAAIGLSAMLACLGAGISRGDEGDIAEQVRELISQLDSDSELTRRAAAIGLGDLGPEARTAIPKLMTLSQDRRSSSIESARWAAQQALESIGCEAVSKLAEAVRSGDSESAHEAGVMLGRIGPPAQDAIPALIERLQDPDPELQASIITTLIALHVECEVVLPWLLEQLQSPDHEARANAAWRLALISSESAVATEALLELLGDEAPVVQARAAWALGEIGSTEGRADAVAPALRRLLSSEAVYAANCFHMGCGQSVAEDAADALASFGRPEDFEAILAAASRDDDATRLHGALSRYGELSVRAIPLYMQSLRKGSEFSAVGLARLGSAAADAVPELRELLTSDDEHVRQLAAIALVGIDLEGHPDAVEIFLNCLQEMGLLSGCAAAVLEMHGPRAGFAVSAMIEAIEDLDFVDIHFLAALEAMGPAASPAAPLLVKHLATADFDDIAAALVSIGEDAIPLLIDVVDDGFEPVAKRTAAIRALGRFGAAAATSAPSLQRVADRGRFELRAAVATTLGEIASDSEQSVRTLLALLQDPRAVVRSNTATALASFDSQSDAIVPALVDALSDEYIAVRAAAARSLGSLGPSARPALGEIQRLTDDPSGYVAAEARRAVGAINGSPAPAVP